MEADDKSQSFENSSLIIIQKMKVENQKQIELNDKLLKNSSLTAIMDKFNTENITRNQPLAEDIDNTVQELLKQNAQLRETLQKNNIFMKQQFTTLAKWHEEFFNIHRTHKQKFEETKELVHNLRAENKELRKPVQEILRSLESKLRNEIAELRRDKDILRMQLQESEQKCAFFTNQITNMAMINVENQMLKEKLGATQQKLEQHYSVNSRSDKEQELIQIIGDLNRQLENSERSRRKLVSDVDRLSAQEQKLQRILSTGESRNITDCCYWNALFPMAVISTPFEVQLIENMKRYEELLSKPEEGIDVINNKDLYTSSWVNLNRTEQEPSIDSLKLEVAELRKLLLQEQKLNVNQKEILETAQAKFKELYKQCIAILKEHDTKMKAMEIESVKLKEKLKDLDLLKYVLNEKENQISHLESECVLFKKKVEEAERKNEDLYLLQSQIKVYEEDFITEREARESLASEKDLLEHNLSCLQQKNNELLRELKLGQDRKGHKSKNVKDLNVDSQTKFVCFNETCRECFFSEEELQEHVYTCLNLKD